MWGLADPWMLLLLPLPFLVVRWLPAVHSSGGLRVPTTIGVRLEQGESLGESLAGRSLLPAIVWLALVVALAGPRMLVTSLALPVEGRDIILALDLSGSMEQEDFAIDGERVSRLDAVKRVASAFVRGRSGDRLGLVIFAEKAYVAAPLTHDVGSVATAIEQATIGISGRSTAISDGLGLALKRLQRVQSPARVVVLLSDGQDTAGTARPGEVGTLAKDLGIKVHSIALGPKGLDDAAPSRNAVDVETLRGVAEASGGTAFRVRSLSDLEQVTSEIDRLEGSPASGPTVEVYRDLWTWPAGLAFLAALAMLLLRRGAT